VSRETSPSVVAGVEAFCERWKPDPERGKASGLKSIIDDAMADEIAAALAELRTRSNSRQ
jgi:hypothetical protein